MTKEGSFSWFLSFTGRLDSPEEPLPPPDESLHVNVRVSSSFVEISLRTGTSRYGK